MLKVSINNAQQSSTSMTLSVKHKISAVAQNVNKSFSKIAKTQTLDIFFDMKPCTSSDAIATQDLHQLMLDLKTKFQTADSYADNSSNFNL